MPRILGLFCVLLLAGAGCAKVTNPTDGNPSAASRDSTKSEHDDDHADASTEPAAHADSKGQGTADPSDDPDTAVSAEPDDEEVTTANGPFDPSEASASCSPNARGMHEAASLDEFRAMIVGAWFLCGDRSVFGTEEQGLIVRDDGTWAKLIANDSGLLVSDTGWNNEGTWELLDLVEANGPGAYQVNFHIDGSGTVITQPVFAQEPQAVRLNNNGVYVADYVRLQPDASVQPSDSEVESEQPDAEDDPGHAMTPNGPFDSSEASARCNQDVRGERIAESLDEFRSMVIGAWFSCDSPTVFGTDNDRGLIIRDDGTWAKLISNDSGQLVPAAGFGNEGSWKLDDLVSWNGPGSYQLDLQIDSSSALNLQTVLAVEPDVMRLDNEGAFIASYTRL